MIARLVRAVDLNGLPVVAIETGEDVAEIKDVVFDGTTHTLVGFTLNKRGWFRGRLRQDLPANAISAIGPDAVMVELEASLQEPDASPAALTGDVETHTVIGNSVISSDGTALGEISGVVVSCEQSPKAVGYELTSDDATLFVPISAQLALSDDNLLLPAEASAFVKNDLIGFGAAIEEFRSELGKSNNPKGTTT